MNKRTMLRVAVLLLCGLAAMDAWAVRRGVRVDFGDAWQAFPGQALGSAGCAGTTAGSPSLSRDGFTFMGYATLVVDARSYCQASIAANFDSDAISFDEPGLAALVDQVGNAVTAKRFTFANGDPIDPSTAIRYQWTFYEFDNGVSIVALYGFVDDFGQDIPITAASTYLRDGPTTLWNGSQGLDDDYFCFVDGEYVGLWNGDENASGACLAPFATLYQDGFE